MRLSFSCTYNFTKGWFQWYRVLGGINHEGYQSWKVNKYIWKSCA